MQHALQTQKLIFMSPLQFKYINYKMGLQVTPKQMGLRNNKEVLKRVAVWWNVYWVLQMKMKDKLTNES
jgi:hypothetical protein